MFPQIDINLDLNQNLIEVADEVNKMGKSFAFDFTKGDFQLVDGKVVKVAGLEAIKVWLSKILLTEKHKFKIYQGKDYGISLQDFINSRYPLEFVKLEIEREVKEALAKNPEILGVSNFEFQHSKRALVCRFSVNTKYGQTGGELKI